MTKSWQHTQKTEQTKESGGFFPQQGRFHAHYRTGTWSATHSIAIPASTAYTLTDTNNSCLSWIQSSPVLFPNSSFISCTMANSNGLGTTCGRILLHVLAPCPSVHLMS